MELTKVCTACKCDIPLSLFSKNKQGKYGRLSHCKGCRAIRRRSYKGRDRLNKVAAAFPSAIVPESYNKEISDLYYKIQMDNVSNGYSGVKANSPEALEIDHIIPLSKGGLHVIGNLQVLTVSENRSKKAT